MWYIKLMAPNLYENLKTRVHTWCCSCEPSYWRTIETKPTVWYALLNLFSTVLYLTEQYYAWQ